MMERHDKEIGAEEYRYMANPEGWFVRYFIKTLNINEEEAMKLKDLFAGLIGLFTPAVQQFEDAKKEKDLGKTVTAVGGIVEVAVRATEQVAEAVKATGTTISSPEKQAMARNAVVAVATSSANRLVDVPGLSEDQEDRFFGGLFGMLVNVLIDSTVRRLNKKGWTL